MQIGKIKKKQMYCYIFFKLLSCQISNLEEHALKHVLKMENPCLHKNAFSTIENKKPTIHNVIQTIRSNIFWKSCIPELISFDYIEVLPPASIVDPSGELVVLTNNVFSNKELDLMITYASFMEHSIADQCD